MGRYLITCLLALATGCAMHDYYAAGVPEVEAPRPSYGGEDEGLALYARASVASEPSNRGREVETRANPLTEMAPPPPQYAQATPTSGSTTPPAVPDVRQTPSSMLIYTAVLVVAVLDVTAKQTQLIERARTIGGFLAEQTGEILRIRVPAARFDDFVAAVAEVGQVLDRRVSVSDVGEEFRDVSIRIQNLEAVRHRFEQMLTQANNVETALAIQRELERVTTELEVLKGRQRYLADQVALSTITVHFQPLASVYPDRQVRLPFYWLEQLGLRNLLTLDQR